MIEGIHDGADNGPLAGYPMTNIRVTLTGGKSHAVDSSEIAFEQAGMLAFQAAVAKAAPAFLEPIMQLEVTAPETYLGSVTGDLNSRRAEITNMEQRGASRKVSAKAPLASMFGYSTVLRSLTQGRGDYSMEFLSYAVVPAEVAKKLA